MTPENPQAFPHEVEWQVEGVTGRYPEGGMTLRDYFAGQTIIGMRTNADYGYEEIAERAYKIADAMLEERVKENK